MKSIRINILKSDLKIYIKVICIIFSFSVMSCVDENVHSIKKINTSQLRITILTPGISLPNELRSGSSNFEYDINRIKILVFKLVSGSYVYQYMADGEQITSSSNNTTTFTATLNSSTEPLKIMLVSNYQDAFDNFTIHEGMSENTVRENLIENFSGDMHNEIPMYGEKTLASLDTDASTTISLIMLRSIARIDIINKVSENISENFKLKEVFIYRANDKVAVIPATGNMIAIENPSVKNTTVPSTSTPLLQNLAYSKEVEADEEEITQMYVSEALPVLTEAAQISNATCIVVGGYYADDKEPTYYRVDFNSGIEGHPFGQILRNHKYVFHIKSVHSQGTTDPDEAANNESASINVSMQIWNEVTSEMYFSDDDHYLGISNREVILDYFKNDEEIIYLQTTVPFQVKDTETGIVINTVGQGFENSFYKVQIVKVNADGEDVYRLLITSLNDNKSDTQFTGQFQVLTDYWTFDVDVKQLTYLEMFNNRIIHVLTVTTLPGDLGTTDGLLVEGTSGISLRKVLENPAYFLPIGKIPVGGIMIHNLENNTLKYTPSYLQKMLEIVDVVHLPRNCTPNSYASMYIYNWLMENKNRVLILGTDDSVTNGTMKYYFEDADGDWMETNNANGIYAISDDDRAKPFFNGPFSDVKDGTPMGYIDGKFGYNDGYTYETTVALMRITPDSPDNANMLTHAINKELGVFYCGDSRITTSAGSAMSQSAYNNGVISSDFDILMANIWAWIVNRVITGNPEL